MLDFPNSPALNQIFTSGNLLWTWDGTKWLPASSGATAYVAKSGDTMTGNLIVNPGIVGIGTTGPQQKLVVTGVSQAYSGGGGQGIAAITTGTGVDGSEKLQIGIVDGTNGYTWFQASLPNVVARNIVLQPNNGNVGIGTTGPQQKLHVSGKIVTTDSIWLGQTTTGKTVPGTNGISTFGTNNGIWSIASSGGQGSVGVYDETAGNYGVYMYSAATNPGFATINNAGGFGTGVMTLGGAGGGIAVGSPTGGILGAGKVNAVEVRANNVVLTSDQELKTEIEPLPTALPLVQTIEPKTFRWKPLAETKGPDGEMHASMPPGFTEKLNRGFIAQEVIEALGGKVEDGVDLGGMVAILWQAVREMQGEIDVLKSALLPVVGKA